MNYSGWGQNNPSICQHQSLCSISCTNMTTSVNPPFSKFPASKIQSRYASFHAISTCLQSPMIKLVQNFSHKSTTSVSPSLMNTLVAKWANQILLIMGYSQSLKSTVRCTTQNARFLWKDLHQPLYIVQALSLYPNY